MTKLDDEVYKNAGANDALDGTMQTVDTQVNNAKIDNELSAFTKYG